ncbi:polysaccharide biosynthesis tyrosine autokinase [Aquibacillus halophilus]|uniref:non-specific protein-tyrosine kinase n=2 Tax=Aquibacillus halophilus TaxID=930132 RepID=A0A6A8DAZ2_9BACI|nr:CpsD/CapB family tyrosine-protein kinase [Aquibacillus halophilus]MRH42684.1 polysaccharide biosynthesis tyrosine autokinase [Aquibacillus halophilus]
MISDQFQTIKTNIKFLTEKRKNKVFLITSPGLGEGKSTISANLAVSMSQQKEKILLIDANLREPIIHTIFKLSNDMGLTDVLQSKNLLYNAINKSGIGNLDVMTSGSHSPNPAELISHEWMRELLNTLADSYDMILIDAPSILKWTETRILANLSDSVVLTIVRGKTGIEKAEEARKVLDLAHANLVGAIITEK